jgi:DNA-binding beta-propeller fold protein YncE
MLAAPGTAAAGREKGRMSIVRRFRLSGSLILLAGVIGCSSPGGGSWAAPRLPAAGRIAAHGGAANLYVADSAAVTVYAPGSDSVLRTIAKLAPTAIAFDPSGNLYVANLPAGSNGDVTVYAAGSDKVLRKITQGINSPKALAFDASGNLYVANSYFEVVEFAPGGTSPIHFIKVFYPDAMIFDRAQNFYVASAPSPYGGHGGKVDVFDPNRNLLRTITSGIDSPVALELGGPGNLFVANYGGNDVTVYAAGKTSVLRTISQGVKGPYGIAFDAGGNLYVSNNLANSVTVYAPGSTAILRTIRQGVSRPTAELFDASGNLYVANAKSVTGYGPGKTVPTRTIVDGIHNPIALGFGP